jgi:hypothetical protein
MKRMNSKSSHKYQESTHMPRILSMQSMEIHKDEIISTQKPASTSKHHKSNIPIPRQPTKSNGHRNEPSTRKKQPNQMNPSIDMIIDQEQLVAKSSADISSADISVHKGRRGPPIFTPKQFGSMMAS